MAEHPVILDSNLMIAFHNNKGFDRYIKDKKVYYIDVIKDELQRNYIKKMSGNPKFAQSWATEILEKFEATFLYPKSTQSSKSLENEVASEIMEILRKADVPEQQLAKLSSEYDVLIAAHGITNEFEVMSNDKLFLPIKELFNHYTTFTVHGIPPMLQKTKDQLRIGLQNKGVRIPVVLTSLL